MKGYKVVRVYVGADERKVRTSCVVWGESDLCLTYKEGEDTVPTRGYCMVFADRRAALNWFEKYHGLKYEVWEVEYDRAPIKVTPEIPYYRYEDEIKMFWLCIQSGQLARAGTFANTDTPEGTRWATRVKLVRQIVPREGDTEGAKP